MFFGKISISSCDSLQVLYDILLLEALLLGLC